MPPENTQGKTQMTTEESAASLGFSNKLVEQLLASQNPQQQQQTQGQPQDPQQQIDELKTAFSGLKEELSGMIEDKLNGIRDDIANAINSDGK